MVFASPIFIFIFLPAVLILYAAACLTKQIKVQNAVLLVFSLAFYAWGGLQHLSLLLLSTIVNYICGIWIGKGHRHKKAVFVLDIVFNIGLLFLFKYVNLCVDTVQLIASASGVEILQNFQRIVLPIGISFFTFQIMSYVIDVYRGEVAYQKNYFYLTLYIVLFPQLIAGPIVRYIDVDKEIVDRRSTAEGVRHGLVRFAAGFMKKIILANPIGEVADYVFAMQGNVNTGYAWLGIVCYSLHIYLDFSAYSDMAIGLGEVFGFHFLENFNYPYCSNNIQEFWRRWHISLSTWFRDYVYFPLGGSRHGTAQTLRNLLIVFALTGIWHGANWTFLIWGMYHGAFLLVERVGFGKVLKKFPVLLQKIYTLLVVMVGWVFFRAETLTEAIAYLKTMFSFQFAMVDAQLLFQLLGARFLVVFIIAVLICHPWLKNLYYRLEAKKYGFYVMNPLVLGGFYIALCEMMGSGFNPFIYFRF